MSDRHIDFNGIAAIALENIGSILPRWLPDGRREGHEYIARNPTRNDRKPGSFKISLRTGAFADFATGAKGGDLIALAAYLFALNQKEAALKIAAMLGVSAYD